MKITQAKLKNKNKLTKDVYELTYELDLKKWDDLWDKAWQFFMFNLNPKLKRAYSIAWKIDYKTYFFIIKRISEWAGSPLICDASIWDSIEFMGPLWHFILKNNDPVLFIGTWAWFAPLYYQILDLLNNQKSTEKIHFIFWVRNIEDIFYNDILDDLQKKYPNFTYKIYLSRWTQENKKEWFWIGYVTQFITQENINKFTNFNICGSPAMVWDVREKLDKLWVKKENINFEQF